MVSVEVTAVVIDVFVAVTAVVVTVVVGDVVADIVAISVADVVADAVAVVEHCHTFDVALITETSGNAQLCAHIDRSHGIPSDLRLTCLVPNHLGSHVSCDGCRWRLHPR